MKIRVSDYVADFIKRKGITHVFSVTGGGAAYLNDSIGHADGIKVIYAHHEQTCAMAAESYARINNKIALVCVTSGPGGTNAITGVLGGWLDSIPMLIVSGQVRYDTTARSTGLPIRAMGDQEFDITKSVYTLTKYCEMVVDARKIRYHLEKAFYIATTGRPGPCWLDIPLNIQSTSVEIDDLKGYIPLTEENSIPPVVSDTLVNNIIKKIATAKRPILYAGAGIRISGGYPYFDEVVAKLNIPVVTCWDSIDLLPSYHPLYTGRGGMMGDRAGNFAVQNSDVLLVIGNRLSIRQVGYNWHTWAREAYVIMCDVDNDEMKKPTLHIDMPVWCDAKDLLSKLNDKLPKTLFKGVQWLSICDTWKNKYPVVMEKHYADQNTNVYAFIKELSNNLAEGQITVVGNGSACVVGSQAYVIKSGQRFIVNSGVAAMGYDLPAAIGASIATDGAEIVCVTGDGSIQMNLQELQTIIHHHLSVKIFIINNGGYHSIRQTQSNLFNGNYTGIGSDSGDLSFPNFEKIASAYGYPYYSCKTNVEIKNFIFSTMSTPGSVIAEVFVTHNQVFEPKSATKRLPNGVLTSPPLEDLSPFLDRDELDDNMLIALEKE